MPPERLFSAGGSSQSSCYSDSSRLGNDQIGMCIYRTSAVDGEFSMGVARGSRKVH